MEVMAGVVGMVVEVGMVVVVGTEVVVGTVAEVGMEGVAGMDDAGTGAAATPVKWLRAQSRRTTWGWAEIMK